MPREKLPFPFSQTHPVTFNFRDCPDRKISSFTETHKYQNPKLGLYLFVKRINTSIIYSYLCIRIHILISPVFPFKIRKKKQAREETTHEDPKNPNNQAN